MKIFKYLAIIIVILSLGYLFIYKDAGLEVMSWLRNDTEIAAACEQAGGNYLSKYNECEMLFNTDLCTELGGEMQECQSACRHDKGSMVCTQQCVPVCTFK